MAVDTQAIEALLREERSFPPSPEFAAAATLNDPGIYERAKQDPEAFWADVARELDWFRPWEKTLDWQAPLAKWFVGGTINAAYNCVDRHIRGARRNKAAIIREGENGESRVLKYWDPLARGEPGSRAS